MHSHLARRSRSRHPGLSGSCSAPVRRGCRRVCSGAVGVQRVDGGVVESCLALHLAVVLRDSAAGRAMRAGVREKRQRHVVIGYAPTTGATTVSYILRWWRCGWQRRAVAGVAATSVASDPSCAKSGLHSRLADGART